MSFESFVSRTSMLAIVPASNGDAKRFQIPHSNDSVASFADIPAECNVLILQFLDVDELANAAQVSRRFHEDILHSSLPQNRTATLICVPRMDESAGTLSTSPFSLFQKINDKALSGQDWRFNKVKIIGHNLLENLSIREVRAMLPGSLGMLQHVRVLDLSFPSNALKEDAQLKVCLPALLSYIMPCLREIDLSNANVREEAHGYFACPELEKFTWNHNQKMAVTALIACPRLKEIYMDDSIFLYTFVESRIRGEWRYSDLFCLNCCNAFLERVSLKNAKCSIFGGPTQIFPETGLVRFVRDTPSLHWFRSDLSPENVAILQSERPEVTFA